MFILVLAPTFERSHYYMSCFAVMLSRLPEKLLFSSSVLLIESSLSLPYASSVMNLSLMQSFRVCDFQPIFGLASDSHDLPRIVSYAMQSTIYGRTVMASSAVGENRSLVRCHIASNVPSQRSAFKINFSLWSFSVSANFFTATISSHSMWVKVSQGKLAALSSETPPF